MNDEAKQLLDSLLSFQFLPTTGKPWSHVALFKEYARRMAWWADTLGVIDNWLTMNICYVLELDEDLESQPLIQLDEHLQTQVLYQPMPTLLQSGLMFAMIADRDDVKQYNLPNPYEVIVKLYTRGGFIRWNPKGFWEVSSAFGIGNITLESYKISKSFVSLDDAELNLIDQEDSPPS